MKGLKAALAVVAMLASFALAGCQYLQPPQPPQPVQPAPVPVQPLPPGPGQPGMPEPGQPGVPGQPGMPEPGQPGMPMPEQPGPHQPEQPGAPWQGQPGMPGPEQPPSPAPSGQPGSSGNAPAGCSGAPMIAWFTAGRTTINAGESVTLEWGPVTNGTTGPLVGSVTIEPGLGEVGSPGARPVTPSQTTTYTLTGKGCGGTATKQLTITVNASSGPSTGSNTGPSTGSGPNTSSCAGAPAISSFSADPATIGQGQKGKLKWGYVTNVVKVEIDQGIGPVQAPGEREVSPSGLGVTTYTLTATGCNGTKITKQASVTVMLMLKVLTFDLGVSDIYPASTGKIWARIKNNGTGAVKNTNITLTCSAKVTKTSGNSQSTAMTPPVSKSIPINLDQGQTADFETSFARDPSIQSMWVNCSITSVAADSNKTNDTLDKQVK